MEWKTSESWCKEVSLAPIKSTGGITPVHSYLISEDRVVVAWITNPKQEWYWARFDTLPPRGAFLSEASVKLACLIYCNQSNHKGV